MFLLLLVLAGAIFLWQRNKRIEGRGESQKQYAGTYTLTTYPGCDSCKMIFRPDNSYVILKKDSSVVEKGDWLYEFGADHFIVYMNNKKDRLGDGRYQYHGFTSLTALPEIRPAY